MMHGLAFCVVLALAGASAMSAASPDSVVPETESLMQHEECADECTSACKDACGDACEATLHAQEETDACRVCAANNNCLPCFDCIASFGPFSEEGHGGGSGSYHHDYSSNPPSHAIACGGDSTQPCSAHVYQDCGGVACEYCDDNGCCTSDPSGAYCKGDSSSSSSSSNSGSDGASEGSGQEEEKDPDNVNNVAPFSDAPCTDETEPPCDPDMRDGHGNPVHDPANTWSAINGHN